VYLYTVTITQLLKLVACSLQQVTGLIILALHALNIAKASEALHRTGSITQLFKLVTHALQQVTGLNILALCVLHSRTLGYLFLMVFVVLVLRS
jgi:hypothetical protein